MYMRHYYTTLTQTLLSQPARHVHSPLVLLYPLQNCTPSFGKKILEISGGKCSDTSLDAFYNWKPVFGDNFLEIIIGKYVGTLKGLRVTLSLVGRQKGKIMMSGASVMVISSNAGCFAVLLVG